MLENDITVDEEIVIKEIKVLMSVKGSVEGIPRRKRKDNGSR